MQIEYQQTGEHHGPRCHCPATWVMVRSRLSLQPRQGTEAESTDRIRFRISISHHVDHTLYFYPFSAISLRVQFQTRLDLRQGQPTRAQSTATLLDLWLAGPPCRVMQARSDRYNNTEGSRCAFVLLWRYWNSTFYIC